MLWCECSQDALVEVPPMPKVPRVFISYSHDTKSHSMRVLDLADQLRRHGCVVLFDQYVPAPPDGWTRWMEQCLGPDASDFVLLVCTEGYLKRIEGKEEPGIGNGVHWEGRRIYHEIYQKKHQGERFVPVLLAGSDKRYIPWPLFDFAHYEIKAFDFQDPGYADLYRRITGQTRVPLASDVDRVVTTLRPLLACPIAGAPLEQIVDLDRLVEAVPVENGVEVLKFRLSTSDTAASGYSSVFTAQAKEPASVPFACDPWRETQTREALERIEDGTCQRDDLAYVGAQLWSGMVHSEAETIFDQVRSSSRSEFFHIRLKLPRRLEELPWEALYESTVSFFSSSERFSVIRGVPEDLPAPPPWTPQDRPVGLLLVMPQGSGLDLASEKSRIQQRADVQGPAVTVEVLEGQVTGDLLRERLRERRWDVVHFAGHAKTSDRGEVLVRLNSAGGPDPEHWMEAEVFSTLFNASGVRLVVMNCCRAASVYGNRGVSGLGPFLLRKGVPAVIAMRYNLPDPTALRFADEFYRVFFGGSEPGRVDQALEKARLVIYQSQTDKTVRDFVTPVLHLAEGHERVLVLDKPSSRIVKPDPVPRPDVPSRQIPEELVASLREGKCLPILGPGLLSVGAVRDETPALGFRDLALQLAQESSYHCGKLFDLASGLGPWIDSLLFQWVCQHFRSQKKIRLKLFGTIQQSFCLQKPTPLFRAMAAWNTPGFICTYFDGLLQQALQETQRTVQVINSLSSKVAPEPGATLLIHLRGHWSDPTSLVLTEEQHNDLLDCLVEVPTCLAKLMRGITGRSPLFLGLDPRDPLVRRLAAKLIPEQYRFTVGPVYFACESPSDDDNAYWSEFETVWLTDPLGDLMISINSSLGLEVSR
jgi:CHAT domain/SIR2-like domain/TIR domain